jgi:2-C-methyl-D-erythritol 4-phosphate cytidylyltransferase
MIDAVIPAGGVGSRMVTDRPKQYLPLVGRKTMLESSARTLLEQAWIRKVVIVVAPDDPFFKSVSKVLMSAYGGRVMFVSKGGPTRRDTVLAGLLHLASTVSKDDRSWVLVHDAARPGLDVASLKRLRDAVLADSRKAGGLLALPVTDTVKRLASGGRGSVPRSAETLDRNMLWAAQTPQMFLLAKLTAALQRFGEVTDEASAIEQGSVKPLLVPGSSQNFKVTTFDDLILMRSLLKARSGAGR